MQRKSLELGVEVLYPNTEKCVLLPLLARTICLGQATESIVIELERFEMHRLITAANYEQSTMQ